MNTSKVLLLIAVFLSPAGWAKESAKISVKTAKEAPRSGEFSCQFVPGTDASGCLESDAVQQTLAQTCDLTKPFTTSIGDGPSCYEAMLLYCCTLK